MSPDPEEFLTPEQREIRSANRFGLGLSLMLALPLRLTLYARANRK